MDAIRWGILGAGKISYRFAASLEQVPGCELAAVAGRRTEKLDAFAAEHPVPAARRYADDGGDGAAAYQRLVDDPDIDAVYLALPHGMHAVWACKLLRAGKAVLCEKPAVLSEAEALEIADAARTSGSLFMEAMKCRFNPAHDRLKELLEGGELGAVQGVDIVHHVDYGDAGGYLLDPIQGGTLYDLGCYGISWISELLDGPVEVERADVRWREVGPGGAPAPEGQEPDAGAVPEHRGARVDWEDEVSLRIGGKPAHLDLSGGDPAYIVRCTVACERGVIEIPMFHRPTSLIVRRPDKPEECIDAPSEVDDFYGEIAHFCELMRAGAPESPVMPLAATIRNAAIIDAIRASW